jgi:hypothetical protein
MKKANLILLSPIIFLSIILCSCEKENDEPQKSEKELFQEDFIEYCNLEIDGILHETDQNHVYIGLKIEFEFDDPSRTLHLYIPYFEEGQYPIVGEDSNGLYSGTWQIGDEVGGDNYYTTHYWGARGGYIRIDSTLYGVAWGKFEFHAVNFDNTNEVEVKNGSFSVIYDSNFED